MPSDLPPKVVRQIEKAGLPASGKHPFVPRLISNARGQQIIEKRAPNTGPRIGKKGYVDEQGRIWIRDHAHAGLPGHWDVQIDDGADYIRVDVNGEEVQKA